MTKTVLTAEEKRSLRLWFRQALAKIEMEEATANLLRMYPSENKSVHRISLIRKRPARKVKTTHIKELVY